MRNVWGVTYNGCCQEVRIYNSDMVLQRTFSDDEIRSSRANASVATGTAFKRAKASKGASAKA